MWVLRLIVPILVALLARGLLDEEVGKDETKKNEHRTSRFLEDLEHIPKGGTKKDWTVQPVKVIIRDKPEVVNVPHPYPVKHFVPVLKKVPVPKPLPVPFLLPKVKIILKKVLVAKKVIVTKKVPVPKPDLVKKEAPVKKSDLIDFNRRGRNPKTELYKETEKIAAAKIRVSMPFLVKKEVPVMNPVFIPKLTHVSKFYKEKIAVPVPKKLLPKFKSFPVPVLKPVKQPIHIAVKETPKKVAVPHVVKVPKIVMKPKFFPVVKPLPIKKFYPVPHVITKAKDISKIIPITKSYESTF